MLPGAVLSSHSSPHAIDLQVKFEGKPQCPTPIILSFRVPVTHAGTKGLIVLDQMRTVDKMHLAKKLGAISAKTLSATLATLQEIFKE